jgi:hypothetical protein
MRVKVYEGIKRIGALSSAKLTTAASGALVVMGTWEGDFPFAMLSDQIHAWTIETDDGRYGNAMWVAKMDGAVVVLNGAPATSR